MTPRWMRIEAVKGGTRISVLQTRRACPYLTRHDLGGTVVALDVETLPLPMIEALSECQKCCDQEQRVCA